ESGGVNTLPLYKRCRKMSVTDVRICGGGGEGGGGGHGGEKGSGGNVGPGSKLPRTLSTSVLRIKHRSSFWEKFGADESLIKREP
ncbi:unnamed protein product, partial [Allacma fusca]